MLDTPLNSTNDLKSSIGALQDPVWKLQNEDHFLQELKSTKTDLIVFRDNSGAKFPQFTKLPTELWRWADVHQTEDLANSGHRLIWRFACTAPQVHIITHEKAAQGRVNKVMNACTEAKSVGLRLFRHSPRSHQTPYTWVRQEFC
jgi:hypothetical protein